jgi:6-pyruvoyl-tetrahydropterin synthase
MSVKIKATKVYKNLPCGHAQYFDTNDDGTPGHCAQVHGYDREVEFTFAGEVDEHGWIVPFGKLKAVKEFLEYYFDHVTVLPADDPRIGDIPDHMVDTGGVLGTLRVLPSGVSMEMSSLFIWEHVNYYITTITDNRCYVERVRVYEHERNDAMCEVDQGTALENARKKKARGETPLPLKPRWEWESPKDLIKRLEDYSV